MKAPQRHQIIHGVLAAFAVALVAKAAQVQLVQHEKWSAAAVAQHTVAATAHGMPAGTRPMPATGATICAA